MRSLFPTVGAVEVVDHQEGEMSEFRKFTEETREQVLLLRQGRRRDFRHVAFVGWLGIGRLSCRLGEFHVCH